MTFHQKEANNNKNFENEQTSFYNENAKEFDSSSFNQDVKFGYTLKSCYHIWPIKQQHDFIKLISKLLTTHDANRL